VSISVALDELADAVGRQAPFAYLLTVSDDGRVHPIAVTLAVGAGELRCNAGGRSRTNAQARPAISLVWPPLETGGYSLIVDGDASIDGETVVIHPTGAVLHRPAPPPAPPAP
jgi:hypothetical protein